MVVFFDIDGTVVDYETQIIPESAVEAIRLLKKNGHLPIVNTGRPIGHVDPRVQKLDFSGWICSCGMELILDGEMIYKDYPSPEECKQILDLAHRCRMAIQTEGHDSLLFDADMPYHPLANNNTMDGKWKHLYHMLGELRYIYMEKGHSEDVLLPSSP